MGKFRVLLKVKIQLAFFLIFCFFGVRGQDLHYSQFYNTPQIINPALTGVFKGDHRFMGSFRDQWSFVPVPWITFSGAYDGKFYLFDDYSSFLGGGLSINHDRQGDSPLTLTSVNLNVSYSKAFSNNHIISGGVTIGLASRGFNSQTLTWDKQWNGDAFDPGASSGEDFDNFERVNFFDSGLGVNYRYQYQPRTFADFGISAQHLITPKATFTNSNVSNLPQRFSFYLSGQVKVIEKLDIQVNVLQQIQSKYQETLLSALGKIYIDQKKGNEIQLHIGAGYRTAGSLFPILGMRYNNYYFAFSYDVDSNGFNDLIGIKKGGPELHFSYIIANVPPLAQIKTCPIY